MKRKFVQNSALLLLFCLVGYAQLAAQVPAQTGSIVAKVIAFRNGNGDIQLTLYNKEKEFPEVNMGMVTKDTRVVNKSVVEVRFDNVPYGTYAIAGLHDENNSGNMDYTWLGLPDEGYCFSNDAKPFLSPPSFSSAMFKLNQKEKVVYITMQY
jgi:uncharacterized protein (DUF2141 family)